MLGTVDALGPVAATTLGIRALVGRELAPGVLIATGGVLVAVGGRLDPETCDIDMREH